MARDPMLALLRLREMALDEVRRTLRDCLDAETRAQKAEGAADAAILHERSVASSLEVGDGAVEAYAAWLPQGRAAQEGARERRGGAELATTHARTQLTAARAGVEAVKTAIARKAEAARLEAVRRDQAALDEIGLRRPL